MVLIASVLRLISPCVLEDIALEESRPSTAQFSPRRCDAQWAITAPAAMRQRHQVTAWTLLKRNFPPKFCTAI